MQIKDLTTDAEILAAYPVMKELRPKLASAQELLDKVRRQQAQGYVLTAALEGGVPVALAGWRELEMLHQGPHIYVDDLVTLEARRSQGHGQALLEHLAQKARAKGLSALTLDSGTQRTRAHRFYLRERFDITSFHFVRPL